jgi:hypothetical protein
MIEFGGILYYIDLNAFDKAITPIGYKPTDEIVTKDKRVYKNELGEITATEEYETSVLRGKEIDASKYDILRVMIDVLLDYEDESDSSLGAERALSSTPLSYKLAFNTLYRYGIIKEKE